MNHRAGFVNIVGNPNVGKSTLMNSFVGEKLSIITSKAQTTRHRILGIVNEENYQIIFSDTPGIIAPAYELQSSMMNFVKSAFEDADILIYMVEIGEKGLKDEAFFEKIKKLKVPLLLILNKIDTSNQDVLENQVQYWKDKLPNAEIYPMSALHKFNTREIFERIVDLLPESLPYYDKDALTDRPERFFVNEIIREKILLFFKKEVPYAVEVITDEFEELEHIVRIRCTIVTERETQKAILLGHKGASVKKIGITSRKDLQVFFDKKVHLELYVKVIKDWRKNTRYLNQFGYKE